MDRSGPPPRRAEAIYAATVALLAQHGYDALTVEAIAERAGVHKTTIYRTWATKDEVLAAALVAAPSLAIDIPDTGSLRGDLIALTTQIAALLTDEATRRVISAIAVASPDRPATAAAAGNFFADRLEQERVVFERARDRGEIGPDIDPATVMNLLGGSLWFHLLIRGETCSDEYVERLVDLVLGGIQAERPNLSPPTGTPD